MNIASKIRILLGLDMGGSSVKCALLLLTGVEAADVSKIVRTQIITYHISDGPSVVFRQIVDGLCGTGGILGAAIAEAGGPDNVELQVALGFPAPLVNGRAIAVSNTGNPAWVAGADGPDLMTLLYAELIRYGLTPASDLTTNDGKAPVYTYLAKRRRQSGASSYWNENLLFLTVGTGMGVATAYPTGGGKYFVPDYHEGGNLPIFFDFCSEVFSGGKKAVNPLYIPCEYFFGGGALCTPARLRELFYFAPLHGEGEISDNQSIVQFEIANPSLKRGSDEYFAALAAALPELAKKALHEHRFTDITVRIVRAQVKAFAISVMVHMTTFYPDRILLAGGFWSDPVLSPWKVELLKEYFPAVFMPNLSHLKLPEIEVLGAGEDGEGDPRFASAIGLIHALLMQGR